ncbi:hypothetical protein RCG19_18715 [Neobacillus sp. OS1-2]|uniref:hypothetical protein n=1 Tax=Neobacillus sp. OS1-2 TaxID=3070680 RepID=UPI0027E1051F|nr:hypothetical protein [Neobacillus sp. OS1-2]WML39197.1 hypothetical protein RCG19_18715 [Neobacillus sp. OS1-2]
MKINRYQKSIIGVIIGCAMAGGWLIVDLLLPEPLGDYLLYPLMAVVNMAIGWQVGRALGKRRDIGKAGIQVSSERTEAKFELKS